MSDPGIACWQHLAALQIAGTAALIAHEHGRRTINALYYRACEVERDARHELDKLTSKIRKATAPHGHLSGLERRRFAWEHRQAGYTLKAVGEMLGISTERVRQLAARQERDIKRGHP